MKKIFFKSILCILCDYFGILCSSFPPIGKKWPSLWCLRLTDKVLRNKKSSDWICIGSPGHGEYSSEHSSYIGQHVIALINRQNSRCRSFETITSDEQRCFNDDCPQKDNQSSSRNIGFCLKSAFGWSPLSHTSNLSKPRQIAHNGEYTRGDKQWRLWSITNGMESLPIACRLSLIRLSFLSYLESYYPSDRLKHYVDIGHAHNDTDEDECD